MINFNKIEESLEKISSALDLSVYKKHFNNLFSFLFKNFFAIIFSGLILNNLLCIYQRIFSYAITPDETENTHNAWSVFNNLVIYKDFFDFKGPIHTFINSFLISVSDIPASFNTLIFLRLIHFFFLIGLGVIIFLIAKQMKLSTTASIIAVSSFYMWDIVAKYGFEIRSDSIQTTCMLLGFYLFIKNYKKTEARLPFLMSGIFLGCMFFIGFDSIVFLLALLVFYVLELFFEENHEGLDKFLTIISGFLVVFVLISAYFLIRGGFKEFQELFFAYNLDLSAIPEWTKKSNFEMLKQFFTEKDLFLTLMTMFGLSFLNFKEAANKLIFLVLVMSVASYIYFGFYPNYAFVFLPFCSILVAKFVENSMISNFYETNKMTFRKITVVFTVIILFMSVSGNTLEYQKELYTLDLERQRTGLDWAIKNIDRSEEVALSKHACPAYIFNKDIRYFRRPGYHENRFAQKDLSTDDLFEKIEEKNTTYFFAHPDELAWTNPLVKEFLEKNFELKMLNGYRESNCIWVRKES